MRRACLGELDRIGEVARLELLRGGEVIHHQSRTLLAELPEGGPYRPAATFDLFPEDLPQEVLDAMLDGACTMRFRIDPADVLTWTNHYTYWDGAMEIPVDWEDVRKAYRR